MIWRREGASPHHRIRDVRSSVTIPRGLNADERIVACTLTQFGDLPERCADNQLVRFLAYDWQNSVTRTSDDIVKT